MKKREDKFGLYVERSHLLFGFLLLILLVGLIFGMYYSFKKAFSIRENECDKIYFGNFSDEYSYKCSSTENIAGISMLSLGFTQSILSLAILLKFVDYFDGEI